MSKSRMIPVYYNADTGELLVESKEDANLLNEACGRRAAAGATQYGMYDGPRIQHHRELFTVRP